MKTHEPDRLAAQLGTIAAALLLSAISVGMLLVSWRKWPDVLVDFGWELYSAWQLSQGAVLYEDLHTAYGPLSFWINGSVFRVFGVSLMSLALFNVVLIFVLTLLIVGFYRKTTDGPASVTAAAVFLSMFAFSQYTGIGNYNFVCPYSHQLTHGLLLSFASLGLLARFLGSGRDRLLLASSLAAGLVFLTKSEVFAALLPSLVLALVLHAWAARARRTDVARAFLLLVAGLLLPSVVAIALLSLSIPVSDAISSLTAAYRYSVGGPVGSNAFYRRISGTDAIGMNAGATAVTAAWYLAPVAFLALVGGTLRVVSDGVRKSLLAAALATLALSMAVRFATVVNWPEVFRGLPLAALAMGAGFLVALVRGRDETDGRPRLVALVSMASFSVLLLAKMALNAHIYHYGFALALPATLLFSTLFVFFLPRWFGGPSAQARLAVRGMGLLLVGLTAVSYARMSKRIYDAKTFWVGSGRDAFQAFDPRLSVQGPRVQRAVKEIERLVKPDETVLVLPQGIMLNYLSRRRNGFPYVHFMPFELVTLGEEKILETLARSAPDAIVLVDIDVSEYGYGRFGEGYGQRTTSWIRENYVPVSRIDGEPSSRGGFGILIARHVTPVGKP